MKIISILREAIKEVFSKKRYILLALSVFFVVLFLAFWLPNLALLSSFFLSKNIGFFEKLSFSFSVFNLFDNGKLELSSLMLFLESLLFGLNVALFSFYYKKRKKYVGGTASIGGMMAGLLGIGCASCGSVLLSLFGFSGAVLFLPFKGEEFNVLSIVLLLISSYVLMKRISEKSCKIQ